MTSHDGAKDAERSLREWLATYDSAESEPAQLLERFLERLGSVGLRLQRASLWLPTAHPELWGTQVVWTETGGSEVILRPYTITSTATYQNTPGQAVYQAKKALRFRLDIPDADIPHPMLLEIKATGATDYLIVPLHNDDARDRPWIAFATDLAGGFSEAALDRLEALCVPFGWKVRVATAESATRSLLRVYLGPHAADRVMGGEFRRGSGEERESIIWFCDLRGFTRLGDTMSASELVALLDRYFECVAGPIEDGGGEILKFVGDAVLAVFPCGESLAAAAERALQAARAALVALATWSEAQRQKGGPVLEMGVSLHVGKVFYGNIGGRSRLDFTVIGAAVNEASRVESLCKELGVALLATEPFAKALVGERLTSLGEHRLRGVRLAQELFTLPEYAVR